MITIIKTEFLKLKRYNIILSGIFMMLLSVVLTIFTEREVSNMITIIKTEFLKLKRYNIILSGIFMMLLSVVLTIFTSTANDGLYSHLLQMMDHFGILDICMNK